LVAASLGDGALKPDALAPVADAWTMTGWGGIRGVTIGPIENLRHAGHGYGSEASLRALDEAREMGATWVSVTPFGRVSGLHPLGIDMSFEAPYEENRAAIVRFVRAAHERGLRVMLVPHLWVESGEWRALIDPGSDEAWAAWAGDYERFVVAWAEASRDAGVDMMSVGVELRSWVTTARVASFEPIIEHVRSVYPGLLTYSANWDDAADTLLWDDVDLVGINAFYPLTDKEGATLPVLLQGGRRVAMDVEGLAEATRKPVVLTEIGYTTRRDPALHPWEWPDGMKDVVIDQDAQAAALTAIAAPFLDSRDCAGFFVWRFYADPDDVSQEAEWGFSPRGKRAELVMRDAFTARWVADGLALSGDYAGRDRAREPLVFGLGLDTPFFDE
jgi:hypothetical protein